MAERTDDRNAGDEYGDTALHRAARNDSLTRVHQLLQAGADPNVCDRDGTTPLHEAAEAGSPETVERLIEGGANPHAREEYHGHTPLHKALMADSAESVEHLLGAGAGPNVQDQAGGAPLHYAAAAGSPETTQRLIEAGAVLHTRDMDGRTALHEIAATRRDGEECPQSIQVAERLLEAGADPNARDHQGNTALHLLAEGGMPRPARMTEALLRGGADADLTNAQGYTPLETAARVREGVRGVHAKAVRQVLEQHRERRQGRTQDQQPSTDAASPKRRWGWKRRNHAGKEKTMGEKTKKHSAQQFAENAAERVIKQLEKGVAPWQKGWNKPTAADAPPHNPVSGTRYKGLNTIVLRSVAEERGYSDPRWLTYKQAKEKGAQVRKGERGTKVEYWKFPPPGEGKDKGADKTVQDGKEPEKPRIIHRTYTVFNAEQCEKMPALERAEYRQPREWEVSERAERLLEESGAKIEHKAGDRAYYRPSEDKIVLPEQEQFRSPSAYYSTTLHEMGHWTGHESRMNRESLQKGVEDGFGSEAYAREELRAEMTSMTVNGVMKLPHEPERHAAYAGSWIKTLKDNPNELRHAARDAGRMADYILKYDRERPREAAEVSREAGAVAQTPERQVAAQREAQPKVARTPEVSLGR